MAIREGKIGIAKVEEDTYEIRLGQPELQPGDNCSFWCRVEFDADDMKNVDMTTGKGKLWGWPPKEFEGGYYFRRGFLGYAPRFRLVRPSYVRCMISSPPPDVEYNTSPYFDATYIDETVEEPQEEVLADGVTEYTWKPTPEWLMPAVYTLGGVGTVTASYGVAKKNKVATGVGVVMDIVAGILYGIKGR